jgi:SAM-dependent methyltransferase
VTIQEHSGKTRTPWGSGVDIFESYYAGRPGAGWEIHRPQPAFEQLARDGEFRGRILDLGCGSGENALMTTAFGLDTTGVDAAPTAIAIASRKARERSLATRFLVRDVLELPKLNERFDTVLDCGLFHCFEEVEGRRELADAVRAMTPEGARYFMLCFSDLQPGTWGPHRVTRAEIEVSFTTGWRIDKLERADMDVAFEPGTASAWSAVLTRVRS